MTTTETRHDRDRDPRRKLVKVQRLERLVALCPACQEGKHAGLASKRGRLSAVIAHLANVNGWRPEDAALYLETVFETSAFRSPHQWTLDISPLATRYGVTDAERCGAGPD